MLTLQSQIRIKAKKKGAKEVRNEGFIPAVLYGPKTKAVPVQVPYVTFEKIYKQAGESTLITLKFFKDGTMDEGSAQDNIVLIRDAVKHPITHKFLHVDFYQVSLDDKITITIPIEYEGEPPGVKDEGGTLVRNLFEVEVRALPMELPHEIRVDVSGLAHIGDAISIKDIPRADAVEILTDPESTVAYIEAPREEEEIVEEATEDSMEDIKTEGEEKREERAEEEAAEGSESVQAKEKAVKKETSREK